MKNEPGPDSIWYWDELAYPLWRSIRDTASDDHMKKEIDHQRLASALHDAYLKGRADQEERIEE